jgi:cation diffusion facilitator family transporter
MPTGSTAAGARICSGGAFLGASHDRNERRTWIVVGVTLVMMLGEIIGGTIFGSIALVADGWHMASHAGALSIAALAYRYARVHANDPRFAFGTGKVGELAGFASAVVLGVVALMIGWESLMRFFNPREIHFEQAIGIAVLGLVVNLASAWLLHQGDDHDHHGHGQGHGHEDDDHDHEAHAHDHDHHAHDHDIAAQAHDHDEHDKGQHQDNNLRAAYMHVLADALTSVLAIVGLLAGWFLGWAWMDPVIGIVGAIVIAQWSYGLIRTAGGSLLDVSSGSKVLDKARARLETGGDRVTDIHIWRLAPGHQALMVSISSPAPQPPEAYKARLAGLGSLSHVTVEVNPIP